MAFVHWLQVFFLWVLSHWEVWFWPGLTFAITYAVKRKYPERWEAWALRYPLGAFVIEFMKAYGIDGQKGPVLLKRYAMRRAGMVPPDAIKSIPVPDKVMKVLLDPKLRTRLIVASEVLLNREADVEDLPGEPPAPSASGEGTPGSPAT